MFMFLYKICMAAPRVFNRCFPLLSVRIINFYELSTVVLINNRMVQACLRLFVVQSKNVSMDKCKTKIYYIPHWLYFIFVTVNREIYYITKSGIAFTIATTVQIDFHLHAKKWHSFHNHYLTHCVYLLFTKRSSSL